MRALVTGVAGFVGSHLAERLVLDGHDVLGVDAFLDYYPRAFKEANLAGLRRSANFRFIEADLNDIDLNAVLHDREWVFHQAAQAGVRASWGTSFQIYTAANISATQRLLEAAVKAPVLRRLVYASSSSVYGETRDLPVTERSLTQPVSPYGVTKLAAEHLCSLYWRNFRVPTVSLRYFTVYGPRHRPDMAFHKFGKAMLEGRELTIYGDGAQSRDFTFVSDVVDANLAAAEKPGVEGMVFNIAGGTRANLHTVLATMEFIVGKPPLVRFEPSAKGDVRDTFADTSEAQRYLDFHPRVALREGLRAELEYLADLYGLSGREPLPERIAALAQAG
jgi:UDP-glucose 4-epimerase